VFFYVVVHFEEFVLGRDVMVDDVQWVPSYTVKLFRGDELTTLFPNP
jgi:hypothetical protein